MRKRIFKIIHSNDNTMGKLYDLLMIIVILISLFPIAIKKEMIHTEIICTIIFIIDYILRIITSDYKLHKGKCSFIIYPFTPLALVDFLSILPTILAFNSALKVLKVFRLIRTLRVLRAFKFIRYSKSVTIIANVFKKQKDSLMVVGGLAIGYISISALIVISIEPETFPTFFDALYWATVSLTTVGYGDIYAVSSAGKLITMISSIFGIAIVALPAGIITAGYLDELQSMHKERTLD